MLQLLVAWNNTRKLRDSAIETDLNNLDCRERNIVYSTYKESYRQYLGGLFSS